MKPIEVSALEQRRLRLGARALGRAGLAHAYGHCSLRLDEDHFLVCAPRPMGLMRSNDEGVVVSVNGLLPASVLGEVRIHQQIYRLRPQVGGIARFQSPAVIALSTLGLAPQARHGLGAYFAPSPPFWHDPRLLRNDSAAAALAEAIGSAHAIVMRGNGAVTVGATLEDAVVLAWYLEDAARVELQVLGTGKEGLRLSPEESRERAVTDGRLFERMWEYMTAGDVELEA